MADIRGLRQKRGALGGAEPPSPDLAGRNLTQPEIFESAPLPSSVAAVVQERVPKFERPDKRTGRTHQFATRITLDLYDRMRMLAARDRLKLTELLERAVDAYERERSGS